MTPKLLTLGYAAHFGLGLSIPVPDASATGLPRHG